LFFSSAGTRIGVSCKRAIGVAEEMKEKYGDRLDLRNLHDRLRKRQNRNHF